MFNQYKLEEVPNMPKTVSGALNKAQGLVNQQRWGQAENLLKQGIKLHPDDNLLKDELRLVQFQWLEKQRRLNDWIMLYNVESLLRQRPLMVSMSESQPDDYFLKLRLNQINSNLNNNLIPLLSCTEYQMPKAMKLAKRCIESANRIERSTKVKTLLKQIQNQQKDFNLQHKKQQAKQVADDRFISKNNQLMLIRSQLQAQLYYEALSLLAPLVKSYDADQEIATLMDEALTGRDLQVLQLISQGDRLYREEQTKEAITIWQQAEKLNPQDSHIQRRIDRALKVIDNLNVLSNE